MGYLKNIVQVIDAALEAGLLSDVKFADKKTVGIAQSMVRPGDKTLELLPCYVNNEGEGNYVGPDDDYNYIGYHRVNSLTATKANVNRGYGDGRGYDAHIIRMSYVVFGRRDILQMTNDELALQVQMNFPEALEHIVLEQLQLKACNINVTDIILNDLQVFQDEFQGIQYFLKPEQFLFKVNYTIESAFLKKCFTN